MDRDHRNLAHRHHNQPKAATAEEGDCDGRRLYTSASLATTDLLCSFSAPAVSLDTESVKHHRESSFKF